MPESVEQTVSQKVREALFAYGKLGLLIEDAPDARLRTAREFYGADGLPAWWLHFDNIEEGAFALGTAHKAILEGQPLWAQGLPLLAVIDRYLKESAPSERKEHPASARAIPWDGGESDERVPAFAEVLAEYVGKLQAATASLPVHVALVTSYAAPSRSWTHSDRRKLDWQLRYHEPVYRLRRRLLQRAQEAPKLLQLFHFGPDDNAPNRDLNLAEPVLKTKDEERAAACRTKYWTPAISDLATDLAQQDTDVACVLVTGAGASLANDALAPGIPPTWFLLDLACWQTIHANVASRPTWPRADSPHGAPQGEPVRSLGELRDVYQGGKSAHDLVWSLEQLFKPHENNPKEFIPAFRQALQAWDHDFPYHSWLLAKLPWTLVLTTNFDGFHERAAASATAQEKSAEGSRRLRRLGEVLPTPNLPPTVDQRQQPAEGVIAGPPSAHSGRTVTVRSIVDGPGLLKPYGSLMTQGPLAMTHGDFWHRIRAVNEEYLQPMLESSRKCWIVIVGHRLASDAMKQVLEDLFRVGEGKVHMLWIEPSPQACKLADFETTRRFQRLLDSEKDADPDHACLLPARALDFAFDLWLAYSKQRQEF